MRQLFTLITFLLIALAIKEAKSESLTNIPYKYSLRNGGKEGGILSTEETTSTTTTTSTTMATRPTTGHPTPGFIDLPIPFTSGFYSSYLVEEDKIIFAIFADTTGWVGFGFTNSSGMFDSDLIVGGVNDDGSFYIGDYTSNGNEVPFPDAKAESDWILLEAANVMGSTFLKFERLLNTGDYEDIIIEDREMGIVWGMGTKDTLNSGTYHGAKRGEIMFNLLAGGEDQFIQFTE